MNLHHCIPYYRSGRRWIRNSFTLKTQLLALLFVNIKIKIVKEHSANNNFIFLPKKRRKEIIQYPLNSQKNLTQQVDTHIQQLDQYLKKFDEELRRGKFLLA